MTQKIGLIPPQQGAPFPWRAEPVAAAPRAGRPPRSPGRARRYWMAALLLSVCLEGMARRYVPAVPAAAWYFLKDAVLIGGLLGFGLRRSITATARSLFGGFVIALVLAIAWTAMQLLNPSQGSLTLGIIGLRSYWMWWIAPVVVASILRDEADRRYAILVLGLLALAEAGMAALQFASPPDAAVNRYAWAGDDFAGAATVSATGRVRVSGTFSYLTGFTDFVILVLPLLMALGMGEARGRLRVLSLAGAGALAIVLPMSGARSPSILVGMAALAIFWSAGALATRKGWAVIAASLFFVALPVVLTPDAVEGVRSRFDSHDTASRFDELLQFVPPYAILENQYPLFGLGTGMQHNLRGPLGIRTAWISEGEMGRYLIELGAVGYLLMWTVRLGLAFALVRAARILRRHGRRAMAGLCYALVGLTVMGNLVFDHVWQALYFISLGLILQAVAPLLMRERAPRGPAAPVTARP